MKFLVPLLALASLAVAEPEADPALAYGSGLIGGAPLLASSGLLVNRPILSKTIISSPGLLAPGLLAPGILGAKAVVAGPSGTIVAPGRLWKRDADAEPEADASLGYGSALIGGAPLLASSRLLINRPLLSRGILPARTILAGPSGTLINGLPVVAPAARLWKRDADAEPEADASLGYGSALIGGTPLLASSGLLINRPLLTKTIISSPAVITPGPSSVVAGPSGTLINGLPVVGPAARLWKREAEAEPSLGYGAALPLIKSGPLLLSGRRALLGAPLLAGRRALIGSPLLRRGIYW